MRKPCASQILAAGRSQPQCQDLSEDRRWVPDAYVCPEGQRPREIQRSKSEQLCSLGYLTVPLPTHSVPCGSGFWIVTAHWEISYSKMESRVWHLSLCWA